MASLISKSFAYKFPQLHHFHQQGQAMTSLLDGLKDVTIMGNLNWGHRNFFHPPQVHEGSFSMRGGELPHGDFKVAFEGA